MKLQHFLSGSAILASGLAVAIGATAARAASVPLGTANGGVAVIYNDNGGGEVPSNQAYVKAQFSLTNSNGAEFNFSSIPLPGTGGLTFYSVFQSVPDQFGLDLLLSAPTNDFTNPVPALHAYENVDGTIANRVDAGPVTWAISGYQGFTAGPANPANAAVNSLFRGGTGANDGIVVNIGTPVVTPPLFTVHVDGELVTDGLVHWYNPATPNTPVALLELTGKFFFEGDLVYDTSAPGETSTNLVDFYAGTIDIEAEVICGTRYVNIATGTDTLFGPTVNFCRNAGVPCKTVQHAVDVACPAELVSVAAGVYPEQVEITRPVTVRGAGKGVTFLKPASVTTNTSNLLNALPLASIVLAKDSAGVNIEDLTIDGGPAAPNSCAPSYTGIYFRNASGTADDVHVKNIVHPSAGGCQGTVGVLVHSGGATPAASVTVSNSMVDNYGKNGITCSGAATDCQILGNTVTGRGPLGLGEAAQNGVQISSGATGSIIGNTITGNDYLPKTVCSTGIITISTAGLTIQNNDMSGNFCDLYLYLVDNSLVDGNTIAPAGDYPVTLIGNGNSFVGNIVDGSAVSGVYVDGINNSLTCNKVTNNTGPGFQFDSSFAGFGSGAGTPNTMSSNSITGNSPGVDATALNPSDPDIDAQNNWWGCAAGPGNPGCDTVTANVDASSPATIPPACVSCTTNAECANGLACDGTETCNLGVCQTGSPVVCAPPDAQCQVSNTCQEPSGTCVAVNQPDGILCSDGEICSVSDTCQSGACVGGPGGDADDDGDCDLAETNCGCNPNDGSEICGLPNRLVGLPGSGAGEVLLNWYTPTVRRVIVATDPSCQSSGSGLCVGGTCIAGKERDLCTSDADCYQPADTCRVIVNYADVPDNRLYFARFGKTDVPGFVAGTPTPQSPILVAGGCSKKVDVLVPSKRSNNLRVRAKGTVDLKPRFDLDSIQYRR